jgi:hypothetical protein
MSELPGIILSEAFHKLDEEQKQEVAKSARRVVLQGICEKSKSEIAFLLYLQVINPIFVSQFRAVIGDTSLETSEILENFSSCCSFGTKTMW